MRKKNSSQKSKIKNIFVKKNKGSGGIVSGQIDGNSKGFGFLLLEKGDLFISNDKLHGARHGDMVKAIRQKEDAAEVVEILSRGTSTIVGTYYESGKSAFVVPDSRNFAQVVVSLGSAKSGEKVVVSFQKDGQGKIIEVLGEAGEEGVDLKSIIRSYGLYEKFPRSVLKNASDVSVLSKEDFLGREDFRSDTIFTIDGADSRDFDDAISIKKTNSGYILGVHIADVSHYVKPNSPMDKEAYNRGTSVYFPFAVLPMLPPAISDDICSLKQGEDRLTLSVIINIDKSGEVVKHRIVEGVINSSARLTYEQAATIIDGVPEMASSNREVAISLKHMHDLCILLLSKRRERGGIDFETHEPKIVMDGLKVLEVSPSQRLISHKIIEEFMVLTNSVIALHFSLLDAPFVYRVHTPPSEIKIERLQEFLGTLGLNLEYIGKQPRPHDFAAFLEEVDPELKTVVSSVMLRAMTKAIYDPLCKGHFGLSLKHYCHFTSPIRRYPDLLIHRIIKSSIKGESLKKYTGFIGDASNQSSVRERLSEEAERRVDDLLVAQYMLDFVGEEFEGIICGVTEWGIFVQLENTAEGIIRTEKLEGTYTYDQRSMSLRGRVNFRMGQKIKVKLVEVAGDRIEFTPLLD